MKRSDFERLVKRIEARYAGKPRALERATMAWVALGLVAALAWLGALFALSALIFVAGIFVEPPGGIILIVVGCLMIVYTLTQVGVLLLVEPGAPALRSLKPSEGAELHRMIESLRQEIGCRPFSEIRVNLDFNAGVYEVARLGVFGWPRMILELGLPLMLTLSEEEFRAVLAHEFAHISSRHGRSSGRLYRLRIRWERLFHQLQRPGTSSFGRGIRWASSHFIDWYWPRLNARARVLSRAHEYDADALAARIAGAEAQVSALWKLECREGWLAERFWPDVYLGADTLAEPPDDIYARMLVAMGEPPTPVEATRWAERGLSRATEHDQTHPSFVDRARAVGIDAEEVQRLAFPEAARPSAAEALLGDDFERLRLAMGASWRRSNGAAWRERYRKAQYDARRRASTAIPAEPKAETEAVAGVEERNAHRLDPKDAVRLWDEVKEIAGFHGVDQALPTLRSLLDHDPSHAGARVYFGVHLLKHDAPSGEKLLLDVLEAADEDWVPRACQELLSFYRDTGQTDRVRAIRERYERHESDVEKSRRERSSIKAGDRLLPHGLDDGQLAQVRGLLAGQTDCGSAWLVRKALDFFPNRPLFLLCVTTKGGAWSWGKGEADNMLAKRLFSKAELPGQVFLIARHGPFGNVGKKVVAFPGSRIYPPTGPEVASTAGGSGSVEDVKA
ncbi:M48 family metallopeptidase [Singulisphaera sp. PoT]|uniref:M48 family metallopeptidase n=1 Tax=Singulisphaera sp. PoT TaxID=3411797 RepID=UPI003BF5CE1E